MLVVATVAAIVLRGVTRYACSARYRTMRGMMLLMVGRISVRVMVLMLSVIGPAYSFPVGARKWIGCHTRRSLPAK
jgi:hypothetical protein